MQPLCVFTLSSSLRATFGSLRATHSDIPNPIISSLWTLVSNHPENSEILGSFRMDSLWGGVPALQYDRYRPKFETWVRIRYFGALSIRGPTARSSSDLAKRDLEGL